MAKTLHVLVTGATGQQGGALLDHLVARGHDVRALTRHPEKARARALAERGVDVVRGDLEDRASLEHAAKGVDAVFLVTTPYEGGPGTETKQGLNALAAFEAVGVRDIVYASVANADTGTGIPAFQSKVPIERYLAESDLRYAVVAPAWFRENLLLPGARDALAQGTLRLALPAGRALQNIGVMEVGAFHAHVLEQLERFEGTRIDIASDATTPNEMADAISEASGREVSFDEIDIDALMAEDEGFGRMFQWFDRTGYTVEIDRLRRAFPDLPWTPFRDWAEQVTWDLHAGPATEPELRPGDL